MAMLFFSNYFTARKGDSLNLKKGRDGNAVPACGTSIKYSGRGDFAGNFVFFDRLQRFVGGHCKFGAGYE